MNTDLCALLFVLIRVLESTTTAVNLKNLTLVGCGLNDLRNEQLQGVSELYAMHCNIPELENAMFLRFNDLKVLEVSDSKMVGLQDYALNGLTKLKTLNLARNNISQMKSWSVSDLTSVTSLDLRRNTIKLLYAESFKRFPNLQKLNLAGNLIESIPYGTLRNLIHLKYINIGSNYLKRIDFYTFRGLSKLYTLALHCNRLEAFNSLALETNKHLRILRLDSNHLSDVEFLTQMNLARIVYLNLSNNAIDSLDQLAFSKAYELKSLDVSHNLIEEVLANTLSGMESLETFNASHNKIHTLAAQSLAELTSLTHLDVSANNLTQLPGGIFNGTHHLRYINASSNGLRNLDSNHFHEMKQLQLLDLSINHLHRDNFIGGLLVAHRTPSMLELDLSNNMYSVLNLSLLYQFARVDLSGNLWDCKWLIREMIRGPTTIHFGRNYTVKDKEDVLSVPGVDCRDEETERSVVVLIGGWRGSFAAPTAAAEAGGGPTKAVFWSKMRLNRFDDKEDVIWMLIAVIVGFILVRVVHMTLVRFVFKPRGEKATAAPVDKELEKIEMISYGDETLSLTSSVDEAHERVDRPNKSK